MISIKAQGAIVKPTASARHMLRHVTVESCCGTTAGTLLAQGATRLRSASTYCPMRGQGATEYLVLLVVLIVALVSVALLGFFPGMASDAQATQSTTYWQSASPIAIVEWNSMGEPSAPNIYAGPYFRLKNNGAYRVKITKFVAGSNTMSYVYGNSVGLMLLSDWADMQPGEEKTLAWNGYYSGLPSNAAHF